MINRPLGPFKAAGGASLAVMRAGPASRSWPCLCAASVWPCGIDCANARAPPEAAARGRCRNQAASRLSPVCCPSTSPVLNRARRPLKLAPRTAGSDREIIEEVRGGGGGDTSASRDWWMDGLGVACAFRLGGRAASSAWARRSSAHIIIPALDGRILAGGGRHLGHGGAAKRRREAALAGWPAGSGGPRTIRCKLFFHVSSARAAAT